MAKVSEKYELMYILKPNMGEEETASLVEKFKALVEAQDRKSAAEAESEE